MKVSELLLLVEDIDDSKEIYIGKWTEDLLLKVHSVTIPDTGDEDQMLSEYCLYVDGNIFLFPKESEIVE